MKLNNTLYFIYYETTYIDTGVYRCDVENQAGHDELTYVVEIQIPPEISPSEPTVDIILAQSR